MKLELKHLAPYLPYVLKVKPNNLPIDIISEIELEIGLITCLNTHTLFLKKIKPILRPLSDLTKEIEHNGEKLHGIQELANHYNGEIIYDAINSRIFYFDDGDEAIGINLDRLSHAPYWVVEKLFEWHFDVFNLLENNLAVNINTTK